MNIADPTLGLDSQARAVLAALSGLEAPEGIRTETAAWYNGRETGIVITATVGFGAGGLHIAIFEHRNSDDIVVSHWAAKVAINPPTCNDRPEAAYEAQVSFRYLDLSGVVTHVQGLLKAWQASGSRPKAPADARGWKPI